MGKLVIVNPGDANWTRGRFVLCFGAYGWTRLLVWASSLDDALDEAVDWLADHAPGLLADEQVREAYRKAMAGKGPDDPEAVEAAQSEAEQDTTCAGTCGHYLNSWEWGIVAENPSRATMLAIVAECGGVVVS